MRGDVKKKTDEFKVQDKYWRIYALVFFVFALAAIIVARLFVLQVMAHEKYLSIAENQHKITQELAPERGEIFLTDEKEAYPLAVNKKMQMAYAVPKEIKEREKTAAEISQILGVEPDIVKEKLSKPEDSFEILKHKLTDEEVQRIMEMKLAGIYLIPENFRFYPGGELASQVAGFVGSDGSNFRGMYGIEAYWEKELSGVAGSLSQERDTRGRWISIADKEVKEAKNGADLVLTINHTVQYEVEKILRETVEQNKADDGTIIAVETKTGKILAMANFPNFNPNDYGKTEDVSHFSNSAVSTPYECGSVFKTITAAAGIDDGKIEPDTTYVDTGSIKEAGYEIRNSDSKAYGTQTMTQVLEKSLNTGAIYIEKMVGNKKFTDYLKDFGFGKVSGVDLPNESPGNISNFSNFNRDINFFTASFGQGLSITPLQLVSAYAAIANKGKLMKPQIMEKIIYGDGSEENIQPQEVRQVISEEASRKVGQMLRSVVTEGHGKRADVPGYLVAGKTGTAQVPKLGGGGYEDGMTIGSFAGFAPVDDPQFAVLVKIDNPKNVQWAESTAAPAFSKVMKFLLEYYGVKPTE